MYEQKNYNVVWFKRDLRIFDHAPFFESCVMGQVLPLYIVETELYTLPDSSPRHWHFIYDCLIDLREDLRALGGNLIIHIGQVLQVMEDLFHQLGHFTLYSHEETGNAWTYERDKSVKAWCDSRSIIWREFPTNGIVRCLGSRDKWSSIRDKRMNNILVPFPENISFVQGINSDNLPSKDHKIFGASLPNKIQKGGRGEGIKVLNSFLSDRGKGYMRYISKPGLSQNHCSRLSAYITYGALSVKEIEHDTKAKINSLICNTDPEASFFIRNLEAFLSRLAWHCHFIQKLEQQPEIEFKCTHSAFEGMRESYFREDFFEAWKSGNTGYPLVDACMRALHQNGWITFRMRALLVSFASYDLWLDWRKTAPFLAKLFTDYEPGIHYSQFQMQSGVTGINTFRIYNPIKQSYDQDKDGEFIRHYVPELKSVPDCFIHEPWKMIESIKNYPAPIVNHEQEIQKARSEISKRINATGFQEEAKLIVQKLGSRNRTPIKSRKSVKVNKGQLSLNLLS